MKKAVLIYSAFVTRTIVNVSDTEEEIAEKGRRDLIEKLHDEGLIEHIEKVIDDEDVPYIDDEILNGCELIGGDGVEYELWHNKETGEQIRVPIEIQRDYNNIKVKKLG